MMKHRARWMLAASGVVLALVYLASPSRSRAGAPSQLDPAGPYAERLDDLDANGQVWAKLGKGVKMINIDGVRFSDAVTFLGEKAKVVVKVDFDNFKKAQIAPDVAVNLHVKSTTYGAVLDGILAYVGQGRVQLTYRVTNGMVIIYAANDSPVVVMAYNVDAMLKAKLEPEDKFAEILRDMVDRDSWVENGGRTGMIYLDRGTLYVAQTPANQQSMQKFLDGLKVGVGGAGK